MKNSASSCCKNAVSVIEDDGKIHIHFWDPAFGEFSWTLPDSHRWYSISEMLKDHLLRMLMVNVKAAAMLCGLSDRELILRGIFVAEAIVRFQEELKNVLDEPGEGEVSVEKSWKH